MKFIDKFRLYLVRRRNYLMERLEIKLDEVGHALRYLDSRQKELLANVETPNDRLMMQIELSDYHKSDGRIPSYLDLESMAVVIDSKQREYDGLMMRLRRVQLRKPLAFWPSVFALPGFIFWWLLEDSEEHTN